MQLDNQTNVSALLWRTVLDEDRIAAAVVARLTYRIEDDELIIDDDQPWVVSNEPWSSPAGLMLADDCFRRGGVDLFILGAAHAPGGRPVSKIEVRIRLGDFAGGVDVYGERLWTRGFGRSLQPSEPAKFTTKPLSLELAYGGTQQWDGLDIPFAANPNGKGWYLDEETALGRPLPNIEDPRHPITRFADRPDPVGVGFCPLGFGPALKKSLELTDDGQIRKIHPTLFNQAFPDMISPATHQHAHCVVFGVHPDGPITFRMPDPPLVVDLQIGNHHIRRSLQIDQIGIESDNARVFITYRFPFRYHIARMQPRFCALNWSKQTTDH